MTALAFQLSYVRTYHSKLSKIRQDMNSIEDRVGRLQVREEFLLCLTSLLLLGSREGPFFYLNVPIILGPSADSPTMLSRVHTKC